jgi:hypothetical protein
MRMMLKATVPVERGNAAIKDGSLQKTIEATMAKIKPEAAYFTVHNGQRTTFMFFEMSETSDMVAALEPLWLALSPDMELVPAMTAEDLQAGFAKAFG